MMSALHFLSAVSLIGYTMCFENVVESSFDGTVAACQDRYPFCPAYAKEGHCMLNAGWMVVNCPVSCNSCHLRDHSVRCTRKFLNISSIPGLQEGEMNTLFGSLRQNYDTSYGITVVSQDPWIVTFDHFISDDEANALVSKQTQWQRSTETGNENAFGEAGRIAGAARTSSNSWCFSDCASDPAVAKVIRRIETVTGLPKQMHEDLQVLKCE